MHATLSLPEPDPAAAAHSARLRDRIAAAIRAAGGWLDFADYMDLALYAPGLGYYSAGAHKFGPAGDFVTAPELGPLFGRTLAGALCPALASLAAPRLLELGAGTGALAADLLEALAARDCLPKEYLVLEVSADLRARQAETLRRRVPALAARVRWLDALPAEPLEAVVVANEVLDALPVSRFRITDRGLAALGVGLDGRALRWAQAPPDSRLRASVAALEAARGRAFEPGYESEICARLPAWIGALGGILARGLVLFADYGLPRAEYYHAQRAQGTLVCHYRHRAHRDPFWYPGLTDISAWVDFTAVAEAADAAGLEVAGYTTQAHFLLAAGLAAGSYGGRPDRDGAAAASALRTLLLPGEMGEAFKVMMLTRGLPDAWPAGGRDLRHLL